MLLILVVLNSLGSSGLEPARADDDEEVDAGWPSSFGSPWPSP